MGEPTLTKFIFSLLERVSFVACLWRLQIQEKVKIPERTLGADTQVLQDEPNPHFVIWIRKFESAHAKAADEIASEHATRLRARIARRST